MADYPPIADHGLIGDLSTAALVGVDGTIDWYCCPAQLANTAAWIAYWHRRHRIPIARGLTRRGRVVRSGVVTHAQLSRTGAGSNHWDPGPGYPLQAVLGLARALAVEG